jgi:ribosomal protein S18 acetylase RimI-like enzyme
VTIRPARAEEAPVVAAILDEATAYVATKGFDQWPVPYPQDELRERQQAGELYAAEQDGEVAAAFVLQVEDRPYWGDHADDALYLHKLAVRRAFAGRELGVQIVEWAAARVREEGRAFLRLDCLRDNPAIRAYYEARGFELRGEGENERFAYALYERRVG